MAALLTADQEARTREACDGLYLRAPELSAKITLTRDQKFGFGFACGMLVLALILLRWRAIGAIVVFLHVLYAAVMLAKWMVFARGTMPAQTDAPPRLPDSALPVYTILVPMFREAASVAHLAASLMRLDYPPDKLDIKLVLEEDDRETYDAALQLRLPSQFELIRVPPSQPRTKPKACNYALPFARGALLTIFDAEDEPDAGQLRRAANAFAALPPDVVCLQARLNYYNADDRLLTRWFSLEYAILFDALLPGLQALGIPIPLGGTSNHFHIHRLRELGAWDPYNVTEDADLGVRLSASGYRTAVLHSDTMEEAPLDVRTWLKQRSRWIKGYMQTWLVHMRDPVNLWQRLGTRGFFGLQFFVGLSWVAFLTAPLVWLVTALVFFAPATVGWMHLPGWIFTLCWVNLLLYFVAHWHQGAHVIPTIMRRLEPYRTINKNTLKHRLVTASLLLPLYWLLHSVAAYMALAQLIRKPHFWEKTTHGVAKRIDRHEQTA